MNSPLVSIIIPVYNSSQFLKDALESICNQRYKNWECVIIDDGSIDNSMAIAMEFVNKDSRFLFFNRPVELPKGGNSCRNFGFKKSKGEFINWFDSDDVMLENFIEEKINAVEDKNDLVISSGYFTDERLNTRKAMDIFNSKNLYQDYSLWKLKIITNSILFRRSFITDKELFSLEIKKGQEFEFFTRIFINLKHSQYKILTEYLFLYRSHNNSITSLNQRYVVEYKESEAFMIMKNLEMSLFIGNITVSRSSYRLLINLLHKAIKNKHQKNINFICAGLTKLLKNKNKILVFILTIIVSFSEKVDISFTRWYLIIKKIPIK